MSTATLSCTPMLTVTLNADATQEQWTEALDWINARVAPGVEPVFVDHGDQYVWLFAAA